MRITHTLAATLLVFVAAIVAPAAQSQARDIQAQPPDMHASVALAAAASRQQQDLRGPDALDAAVCPRDNSTALVADMPPAAPASSTDDGGTPNPLGAIAAGLLVIAGLAVRYSRRGERSQRLHANP
jgi:hypothetical protein